MNKLLSLLFTINTIVGLYSQEHHSGKMEAAPKTLSEIFTGGEIEGHIRNYFMTTINPGDYKDYYTNAIGGAIAFKTMRVKGLEAGVMGIFTYKAFSSDLNHIDPLNGRSSLYERQLYDITDPENYNDLDRLEELYLKYHFRSGYITYGKMEIEDTPLLNESDGRMKPFAFKGVWLHLNRRQHQLDVSWIDRVSPRSTVEWYDFNEAIGLAYSGFQPDGSPSHYHEHTNSRGIALLQYRYLNKHWNFRLNHWFLHRIFNTGMIGLEYSNGPWMIGGQYAIQIPSGHQKELAYVQRYLQPDERGRVLSTSVVWSDFGAKGQIAYSRAFGSGRFLFPRELGRDHFYTSMARSRLDGLGDVHVITANLGWDLGVQGLFFTAQFSAVFGPQVGANRFNKYNQDAYQQWNTELNYNFNGFLHGLQLHLLYVKRQNKEVNSNVQDVIPGNFDQLNMVINYEF